jgi:hypothetical protein
MMIRALKETINDLNEEMISLCEIRGELSDEDNTRVENRINEIKKALTYETRR